MDEAPRTLITGANGRIGSALRSRLRAQGHVLVCVDVVEPRETVGGEEWYVGSVTDRALMALAMRDVDAVMHLGGHPSERPWGAISETNIDGTLAVLEAALDAGVQRVMIASSIHAAGYATLGELRLADPSISRPDTYYGVGKVAGEALASVFADRFGMTVVSARIASYSPEPANARAIGLWLSPDDCARLAVAVCRTTVKGHRIVWGVSANTRGPLPLDAGRAIGFEPRDDAEAWSSRFAPEEVDAALHDDRLAAGGFVDEDHPLGG